MNTAIRECDRAMRNARDYRAWRDAAVARDALEDKDAWRHDNESADYDWKLVHGRLLELRRIRSSEDIPRLVHFLHEGLHGNMGNMANPALYSHTYFGTKHLITDYIREVCEALNYLADNDFPEFPLGDKLRFFKRTGQSFGRSGILLSGGATYGMFHIGVVKALWDEGLLPRVISGSSAGSIIASTTCAHTNEELSQMFDPEYLYLHAWRSMGLRRAVTSRAMMDGEQLEHAIKMNVGDVTFEEAFARTGRILNITVSPTDPNQQGRLLNYLTSPSVLIRRASVASCAIPGVFPPVQLEAKDFHGNHNAYLPGTLWVDGSLHADLPMLRLARLHNVNHYIVSQTNPHIIPFLSQQKEHQRRRKGLLPFARDVVTSGSYVYANHVIGLAREHTRSETVGRMLEKLHSVSGQRYSGDINIIARLPPKLLAKLLANPSPEDIKQFVLLGERQTWPLLERIRNTSRISSTFEACLQRLKATGNSAPGERMEFQREGRFTRAEARATA